MNFKFMIFIEIKKSFSKSLTEYKSASSIAKNTVQVERRILKMASETNEETFVVKLTEYFKTQNYLNFVMELAEKDFVRFIAW